MYSDNGTNFVGANRELKEALAAVDKEKLEAGVVELGIKWNFIPAHAPHMGGAWERLVRSIKTALHSTLKERAPKDEVLHTLLLEAEQVVNSRPLTYVSPDGADPEALTPNHFLIGSSSGASTPGHFTERDLCLKKQWKETQALANIFWTRWVREYLPTLNKRSKWTRKGIQLAVGDLVFIADGKLIRGTWPMGRVTATFPGKEGHIRVVDVETSTGGVYRRAVANILIPNDRGQLNQDAPDVPALDVPTLSEVRPDSNN
jgi:hypothetical protein